MHNERHYRGCSTVGVSWVPLHVVLQKFDVCGSFHSQRHHGGIHDRTKGQQSESRGKHTLLSRDNRERGGMFIWNMSQHQSKRDMGEGAAVWNLGRELTIGHTRGEVVYIVSTSAEVPGLSHRLRWLALQHVDYVHTVNTLQSCIQALHCRRPMRRGTSRQRKREGREGGFQDKQQHHYNNLPSIGFKRCKLGKPWEAGKIQVIHFLCLNVFSPVLMT